MTAKVESCELKNGDLLLGRMFGQVTTPEFERETATDYELARAACSGDMSAFEELFTHQLEVHRPIIEQDRLACSGVQKGLRSSLAARGRLAWEEEPVAHFSRWLIERYRRGLMENASS